MANMFVNAMTALWNSGATTYYVIKVNVTNSASAVASRIMDLQVAAVSKFSVDASGNTRQAGNTYMPSAGVIDFGSDVTLTHSADTLTMAGGYTFDMQYSEDGAGYSPELILTRISASPAIDDIMGTITFRGRDSAANAQDYLQIQSRILDPTSGNEDAEFVFRVVDAGTMKNAHYFNYGQYQLVNSDSGSTSGPTIQLYRTSTTPAASDFIGKLEFLGRDSAANQETFAQITAGIVTPTSTLEDGVIYFETKLAGVLDTAFIVGSTGAVQRIFHGGVVQDERSSVTLTTAGLAIIPSSYVVLDTFAAAATDDITDILLTGSANPSEGMRVTFVSTASARDIVFRHNLGGSSNSTIYNTSGASTTLALSTESVSYIFRSGLGWIQTGGKIT